MDTTNNVASPPPPPAGDKNKKKAKPVESNQSYVRKIMRRNHPGMRIKTKAAVIMDRLTTEVYQRIASEAGKLTRNSSKVTLSEREIQTACKLVFPIDFQQFLIPRIGAALETYKSG